MAQTSTKALLHETAGNLPTDASADDAMERLFRTLATSTGQPVLPAEPKQASRYRIQSV